MYKILVLFLTIFVSCTQKKVLDFLPKLNKSDAQALVEFFNPKEKRLTLEDFERVKKVQANIYFKTSISLFSQKRYIEDYVLFIGGNKRQYLYKYNIKTREKKILKEFPEGIKGFDINSQKNKIIIEGQKAYNPIWIYTFPNFTYLQELEGYDANFDIKTDKVYFLRGGYKDSSLYLMSGKNQEKVLYQGFHEGKTYLSVWSYVILSNGDIFLSTISPPKFYEFYLKEKYKAFLLSNPKNILLTNGEGSIFINPKDYL